MPVLLYYPLWIGPNGLKLLGNSTSASPHWILWNLHPGKSVYRIAVLSCPLHAFHKRWFEECSSLMQKCSGSCITGNICRRKQQRFMLCRWYYSLFYRYILKKITSTVYNISLVHKVLPCYLFFYGHLWCPWHILTFTIPYNMIIWNPASVVPFSLFLCKGGNFSGWNWVGASAEIPLSTQLIKIQELYSWELGTPVLELGPGENIVLVGAKE